MKIIHTSDWHLGHRLYEQSQQEEQKLFLDWLLQCVLDNDVDVLLVAGDIFDVGVPSTQSQKLYYDFLIDMRNTNCKHIIITGGNHDAPGTLNAPKELLHALSVDVVGKATGVIADEVFELKIKDEEIIVAAAPYLRDQDIRRAVAGESFNEIGGRYHKALTNHYNDLASYCESINVNEVPVIAMGHLFAIGGQPSDSEQRIYVGNLGDIHAKDFPAYFDYVALGHLHRPQTVDKNDVIRYSGSPYVLSFSEVNYDKKVILLETNQKEISNISWLDVPHFRPILKLSGSFDHCVFELNNIERNEFNLMPWVEVLLDSKGLKGDELQRINELSEELNVDVLKVSYKKEKQTKGLNELEKSTKKLKELTPIEVFELKCKEMNYDLGSNPEVLDAFNEILQIVSKN